VDATVDFVVEDLLAVGDDGVLLLYLSPLDFVLTFFCGIRCSECVIE